jgi:CRISPR type I-F-associated protein Csy2
MIVVVGPYRLQGGNAMHNDLCQGIVAPTALAGFAYATDLKLRADGNPLGIVGAGVIVHDHEFAAGQAKLPPNGNDLRTGKGAASIVAARTVDATISLVLEIVEPSFPDELSHDDTKDAVKEMCTLVDGRRLGGGVLMPIYRGRFRTTLGIAYEQSELRTFLRRHPGGWFLKDRHDLLEELTRQFEDPMDALLHALVMVPLDEAEMAKAEAAPKTRIKRRRNVSGAVVPVAVGYAAIETPKARRTLRSPKGAHLHVYAESVTSLGEYVHLGRSLRHDDRGIFDGAIWRYRPDGNALFVARGA